ncbi:MAG: O-antigen ligase family protein [Bacteroidia bacterium]|nr:O-antigen ligase family protein [Bacteroidia bacterium]NND51960.1 O-antigen ligase family protein [Flavobacteriaceae bacterium]
MKTPAQKISVFSILAFGLFLLVPSIQRWYLVILLGLAALLILIQERKIKFGKTALINTSLYLTYLFSLLFVFHPDDAPKRLEMAMSLLFIPIIFSVLHSGYPSLFTKKIESLFAKVFFLSSVVFSILIFIYFAHLGYFNGTTTYEFCMSQLGRKMPLLNDHPIYLSMPMGLSVLFSIEYFKNSNNNAFKKLGVALLTLFLLFTIFFLARRGVIGALLMSIFFLLLLSFKAKRKVLIFALVGLIGISAIFVFIPVNQKRISELFKPETYSHRNETNSTNNRLQIYDCALDLIMEKPIFGYGIGRDKEALFNCYKENLYYLFENRYNTHNQYLSITMKTGLAGLLVFLFFLCYNFKLAYRNQDWLFFSILIFFTIVMLSENILERQNGLILFAFLVNFFAFKNLDLKTSE